MEMNEIEINCQCENCQLKEMFFSHLSNEELFDICSIRKEREYFSNEIIIRQGELVEDFFYLKEGLVKLHILKPEQDDQIITIAKPLDFISVLSIFSSDRYKYTITALVPSVVCQVKMSLIKKYADINAAFSFDLMTRLSKSTDDILLETMELKRLQLKGKLAYILLKFARHIFQSNEFELPVTRKEIAEYAGVSTENIIRALSEFRKDKLIRISGKEIEILDMLRVEQIAKFG
jgi:CRP-like cAMP-binding protein